MVRPPLCCQAHHWGLRHKERQRRGEILRTIILCRLLVSMQGGRAIPIIVDGGSKNCIIH